MGRTQWRIFIVGMVGFILPMPFRTVSPIVAARCTEISSVVLVGGVFGWMIFSSIRNMRIRRNGVPMIGRIQHCRKFGYFNRVPNYEIEAELSDGTMTRLMVQTYGEFRPGQSIALLVDPRRPRRAVLRLRPRFQDF